MLQDCPSMRMLAQIHHALVAGNRETEWAQQAERVERASTGSGGEEQISGDQCRPIKTPLATRWFRSQDTNGEERRKPLIAISLLLLVIEIEIGSKIQGRSLSIPFLVIRYGRSLISPTLVAPRNASTASVCWPSDSRSLIDVFLGLAFACLTLKPKPFLPRRDPKSCSFPQ